MRALAVFGGDGEYVHFTGIFFFLLSNVGQVFLVGRVIIEMLMC